MLRRTFMQLMGGTAVAVTSLAYAYNDRRRVELFDEVRRDWVAVRMSDLQIGDRFRMFEGNEQIGGPGAVFIARNEPRFIDSNHSFVGPTWSIEADEVTLGVNDLFYVEASTANI